MKSTTSTDGVIRIGCESLILSAILRLSTDGEGDAAVVSAHHRQGLEGELGPGRWVVRLTRAGRPSHGLQGTGREVNSTTTRLGRMAVSGG